MIYNDIRKKTKKISVGKIAIGGDSKIAIQSMTNTDTGDADATINQIRALAQNGCDIVRIAVPSVDAAKTVKKIKDSDISIPIVADIHFDYKIALECAKLGIDKIRINPGNIGADYKVREVCEACSYAGIPIRIGVNSGSLEKNILAKYGAPTPDALCESALYHVSLLEKFGFYNTVISIKTSNVPDMITANRKLSELVDYPLHLGVTEAGSEISGIVKSSVGIGALLCDGIGDTIRVSLTADPLCEAAAAKRLITAIGIEGQSGMNIISCPTCGRTKIDLIPIVERFEKRVAEEGLLSYPINVALMGCVVNGPGEAREADIGIAGGDGEAVIISHGEIIAKISEGDIVEALIEKIKEMKR